MKDAIRVLRETVTKLEVLESSLMALDHKEQALKANYAYNDIQMVIDALDTESKP